MKKVIIFFVLLMAINSAFGQQVQPNEQTNAQLAVAFYNSKDFEKAIPLLLEVYSNTKNTYYYRLYITSLIQLNRFEEGEVEITKLIKQQRTPNPEFLVYLGYILEAQNRKDEASEKYQEAIESIPPNKGSYVLTANTFLQWGQYEFAIKTYLRGRQEFPEEQFNYELARAHMYLRDYEQMLEEYLNLLKLNENQLSRVQSSISSAIRIDIDNSLRNEFRQQVLKRIQSEPNITGYNRLLIWFFLQDKNFSSALRQSIALDRRTGVEDNRIAQLGQMALNNNNYDDAQKAYEYLMGKGEQTPFFQQAFAQSIHVNYYQYIHKLSEDNEEAQKLAVQFEEGLKYLGYFAGTLNLIQEYAHFLAFYLNDIEKSIEVLQMGIEIPGLKPEELGKLKTEMADVYVYANDPWEATLIYSQVIEANKTNSLGDDVKLKKAKLGYYMGNFSWAKAQLDVLKASTSKLTANDALDLSLLIGNNLNLDTTAIPLTMFAKADLLFFQNKPEDAMTILEGLMELYPYHSLIDDILYRKAKIEMEQQNFIAAAEYLEQIVNDFSYEILGDDALFELAGLYNYHLGEKEKARDLYKQMLFNFPGSVFVEESRNEYRELREIYPETESDLIIKEDLFMEGIAPDEIN